MTEFVHQKFDSVLCSAFEYLGHSVDPENQADAADLVMLIPYHILLFSRP
jgi:hypothetical protein